MLQSIFPIQELWLLLGIPTLSRWISPLFPGGWVRLDIRENFSFQGIPNLLTLKAELCWEKKNPDLNSYLQIGCRDTMQGMGFCTREGWCCVSLGLCSPPHPTKSNAGDWKHTGWASWFVEDARSSCLLYHDTEVGSKIKLEGVGYSSCPSEPPPSLGLSCYIYSFHYSAPHKVHRTPRRPFWSFV